MGIGFENSGPVVVIGAFGVGPVLERDVLVVLHGVES